MTGILTKHFRKMTLYLMVKCIDRANAFSQRSVKFQFQIEWDRTKNWDL